MKRRKFISIGLWGSVGFGLNPLQANNLFTTSRSLVDPIDSTNPWEAEKSPQAIKLLYPDKKIIQSDRVKVTLPKLAENASSIPVNIKTDIEAKRIIILQDANPTSLVGIFEVPKDALVDYSFRIKMRQIAYLTVLIEDINGMVYLYRQEVELVAGGGCGG